MRILTITTLTVMLSLVCCFAGCARNGLPTNISNRNTSASNSPKSSSNQPVTNTQFGGNSGVGGVRTTVQKSHIRNDLKQIGILYKTYQTENGKSPGSQAAFAKYIKTSSNKLYNQITIEKKYVIIPNAPQSSTTIIAYHKVPDPSGNYMVARGDGAAVSVSASELKKYVKNP